MNDGSPKKEAPIELTVLAVLGWILPLAGLVWGPGEWWEYLIWLAIGTAAIVGWGALHPDE